MSYNGGHTSILVIGKHHYQENKTYHNIIFVLFTSFINLLFRTFIGSLNTPSEAVLIVAIFHISFSLNHCSVKVRRRILSAALALLGNMVIIDQS